MKVGFANTGVLREESRSSWEPVRMPGASAFEPAGFDRRIPLVLQGREVGSEEPSLVFQRPNKTDPVTRSL